MILEGTLLPIDWTAADAPYHPVRHKRHGMNSRSSPFRSDTCSGPRPALPGSAHDLTAARHHGVIDALTETGLKCWADNAYQGAGGPVRVPFRVRPLKRPSTLRLTLRMSPRVMRRSNRG